MRALAATLNDEQRIDLLVNNIGISLSRRQLSRDGNDMMLQVNHLSPFLLTILLLEKLKASAPARIVNVSSRMHRNARDFGFDDFQFVRSYGVAKAYAPAEPRDRKSTRLNSSHFVPSRMPSSA